jgi:hypothetical protein
MEEVSLPFSSFNRVQKERIGAKEREERRKRIK